MEELEELTEKFYQDYHELSQTEYCAWKIYKELMREHLESNRDQWTQNEDTPVLQIQIDYLNSI